MPAFPNLYLLAKVGGGVALMLIFGGIVFFRIRRTGSRKKKRQ
jgi:hypothetical protein